MSEGTLEDEELHQDLGHHMRSPLAAIHAHAENLRDELSGRLTEAQAQEVGAILASCEKLEALIGRLLREQETKTR